MPYSDLYRSAMNKTTASEHWKAETLKKMHQEQTRQKPRKPSVHLWKRAAMPLAAAAVFALFLVPAALHHSESLFFGITLIQSNPENTFAPQDGLRTAPQPAMLADETDPSPEALNFGADCVVSAGSAQAALPTDTVPFDHTDLDQALLQSALNQLDKMLLHDKEAGKLSYTLTQSNVLAQGVLRSSGSSKLLFVLPAEDPTLYTSNSTTLEYLIYAVELPA